MKSFYKSYFLLILSIFLFSSHNLLAQPSEARSYYRWQTTGQSVMGPISDLTNGAITANWRGNHLFLKLGANSTSTLTWKYEGRLNNGLHYYEFESAKGIVMPGATYTSVLFTQDWSIMQINYMFGVGNFPKIQMYTIYKFLTNGEEAADEYNKYWWESIVR